MLVGKSRLMGRQSCEVLSVIHGKYKRSFPAGRCCSLFNYVVGNIGLGDLQSRLIETTVMYEEQLQGEIREENERAARDQVKAEQDMAYEETLQADMAKEAAKRQKEAAQAAERKRIESERAEEDARRESIRLVVSRGDSLVYKHCIAYIYIYISISILQCRLNNHYLRSRPSMKQTFPKYECANQRVIIWSVASTHVTHYR